MTKLLVVGKNGQVGWELQRALIPLGQTIAVGRSEMDLAAPDSIRAALRQAAPDIIINAAAYTAVDKAEAESELALQINAVAPGVMAEEAKRLGALLIHYSTDYVFDGTQCAPYTESDAPNPLSLYGKSKLTGEQAIASSDCAHLILRTSWVYSARGSNFVLTMLRLAQQRPELSVVDDQIGSPTWARALAQATAELLDKPQAVREKPGVYHLSAAGQVSRYALTQKIIAIARGLGNEKTPWATLRPIATADYPLPATRPLHAVLSNEKIKRVFGIAMPDWESQLQTCLQDILVKPAGGPG